ncbi:MAG TPA: chloride channel protein [Polyangiaceae bacterium]|jgi:CIC family chloride channel protein|nr:chloride channel protein [Polyangiaceae bacterium]
MSDSEPERPPISSTGNLPVSPSLAPTLDAASVPRVTAVVGPRVLFISALAIGVAFAAGIIARVLVRMIAFVTNAAFLQRISLVTVAPASNHLGALVVVVPAIGGLIVGVMARYGSKAIRGHGIPEAMEQVLTNQSRIPPRLTFLKPLSAAIAIGTGGPFGAEGPIIATGGALGSLVGQVLGTTSSERKTLLAAGAAAGMAATFGSPVSAVLLAVELLLFEFRSRSIIPVALASATAAGVRMAFVGSAPVFAMPQLAQPSGSALAFYILLGALIGWVATLVTRAVYAVEDAFEKLPIHWMWWPALGGLVVGGVGYFAPHTMGVGYDNIEHILQGSITGQALLVLFVLKFVSWSISLGSGTSGGTLAPLFTIGGGLGATLGALAAPLLPSIGIDPRIAGLVGMAAIFAGASRALLASVVFAFETTLQPLGLLPLLGGCAAAYLVSCFLMRNTIMTEKIARRGIRVPSEYAADFLDQIWVGDVATREVVTLDASDRLEDVRKWLDSGVSGTEHHGFPVLDEVDRLVGVVTRRELLDKQRADDTPLRNFLRRGHAVAFENSSLREAADLMVKERLGRLPVVSPADPSKVVAILTRSDLLAAHGRRLTEDDHVHPRLKLSSIRKALRLPKTLMPS